MLVSKNHLRKFLKKDMSDDELSSRLFQLGHENEFVNNLIDLEITPNRGDCLSLYGIARDLNNFYDFSENLEVFNEEIAELQFNFQNNAIDDCPRIAFLLIEVEDLPVRYKPYLEEYFTDLEIKKNNFFTDVSNYLSYEIGQPTHCYDFTKLHSGLKLTRIKKDHDFKTITNKQINIKESDLVFTLKETPINLAGVMGGFSTGCTQNSKTVLVECAYFEPESIIGKSIKYDLNSEAAFKFERGTDPDIIEMALRRFIKIVEDHTTLKDLKIYKEDNFKKDPRFIEYDLKKINSILGVEVIEEDFNRYINNLGFQIKNGLIFIPSHRHDIQNYNDIAEEIARLIGYDNLKKSDIKLPLNNNSSDLSLEDKVRSFLVEEGFSEVINFPFSENDNTGSVEIDNPLDSNKRFFRKNITESIVQNVIYNERRQKDSIKLFEISDIYRFDKKNKVFKSTKKLALILSGRKDYNFRDFNIMMDKKLLDTILSNLTNETNIEVNQISRENLDSKIKHPIYSAEIELKLIDEALISDKSTQLPRFKEVKYSQISEFPLIKRDLSFQVDDINEINELCCLIDSFRHELLRDSFIFDFYQDEKRNRCKVGFRFSFQSMKKTLIDAEVDEIIDDIVKSLSSLKNTEIPGYDYQDS
tara:strand:- start:1077 stop:3005 length:1929 start_codon:yes stop_codon:yes gene_type:complete